MASAKAMDRIDCTRILVDAPGLRPTAVEAAMPIKPTPMAAPAAASPTWMLPLRRLPPGRLPPSSGVVISANIDIYPSPFRFLAVLSHLTGPYRQNSHFGFRLRRR